MSPLRSPGGRDGFLDLQEHIGVPHLLGSLAMPLEIVIGAVIGAAVANEPTRRQLRKGLVYGLAGVLVAYDKVAHLAQSARRVVNEKKAAPSAPATTEHNGAPVAAGALKPEGEAKTPSS